MKRILVLFMTFGLLASACGSDSADTDAGADSEALTSEAAEGSDDTDAETDTGDSDAGGEDDSPDDADDDGAAAGDVLDASELDDLLAATSEQTSGRFEATMEMTGGPASEIPGSVTIAFSGSFDEAAEASEISMDMSDIVTAAMAADPTTADDPEAAAAMAMMAPFFEEPMQVRTIGDRAWVKWGLLAMFGAGDKWLETDADGTDDLTQDFGFDAETPAGMLGSLADSGTAVEFVGEEELRGMTASRYRSEVDVASMTAEQRSAFGDLPEDGTYILDLWIADDLVQRFQIEMTDLVQTADNDLASLLLVYDLFDHGGDVAINPPPPDDVVTEAELGFDMGDFGDIGG